MFVIGIGKHAITKIIYNMPTKETITLYYTSHFQIQNFLKSRLVYFFCA